jgi:type VI secretion system secreted protein Hcp
MADIFAKIGDITGESADAKHKDEIEVQSFSWSVSNSGPGPAGSGAGVGKPSFHDLSFVHNIDKASPVLLQACARGTRFAEATITHRKAGRTPLEFLIVKMSDVAVTAVAHGGTGGQLASESVSLTFAKVDFEYRPQKADGSIDAGIHFKYDIANNKIG